MRLWCRVFISISGCFPSFSVTHSQTAQRSGDQGSFLRRLGIASQHASARLLLALSRNLVSDTDSSWSCGIRSWIGRTTHSCLDLCVLEVKDPLETLWTWLLPGSLEVLWEAVLWAKLLLLHSWEQLWLVTGDSQDGSCWHSLVGSMRRIIRPSPENPVPPPSAPCQPYSVLPQNHMVLGGARVDRQWMVNWSSYSISIATGRTPSKLKCDFCWYDCLRDTHLPVSDFFPMLP